MKSLDDVLSDVRGCRVCADRLPFEPRPILQISGTARILIASQAPGAIAHDSGVPFADASGDRLRAWMGFSAAEFYDAGTIAIVPMGLCYPGRLANRGDAPPRRECAPMWRNQLLATMPDLRLTLLVGSHAQAHVLGRGPMTDRVKGHGTSLPGMFPLPHPSWRVRRWMAQNLWFERDVLPALRARIRDALS